MRTSRIIVSGLGLFTASWLLAGCAQTGPMWVDPGKTKAIGYSACAQGGQPRCVALYNGPGGADVDVDGSAGDCEELDVTNVEDGYSEVGTTTVPGPPPPPGVPPATEGQWIPENVLSSSEPEVCSHS
jgi:hypothetical protein